MTGLRAAELTVEVLPVSEVRDIDRYDAFVVGARARAARALDDAFSFIDNRYIDNR